jgi:HSP20 family protein
MAREQDDLLIDDDLAAFIDGSGDDAAAGDAADQPDQAAEVTVVEEQAPIEEWEQAEDEADEADDLPGQLAVDVFETRDKLVVKARTAGISGKDLDVSVSDNILTISGVLHGSDEEDVNTWHIQECYWGEFSRTIALPVQVQEEGVQASLKNGILTISFDKVAPPATNKVNVVDL